jgi:hypothetical protein
MARLQPSDSLPPSATPPVPLDVAYLDADSCSVPQRADGTCARIRVVRRRRVSGSPLNRDSSRRGEGLPGYGTVLFVRAMVEHPAGYNPLLAQYSRRGLLLPSGKTGPSASGKHRFRGRIPMARTLACLRFAEPVSRNGARRATGSGGLTLGRTGFAPAGRCTKFHGGIASSNSLRPTGPGRTVFPILEAQGVIFSQRSMITPPLARHAAVRSDTFL